MALVDSNKPEASKAWRLTDFNVPLTTFKSFLMLAVDVSSISWLNFTENRMFCLANATIVGVWYESLSAWRTQAPWCKDVQVCYGHTVIESHHRDSLGDDIYMLSAEDVRMDLSLEGNKT